MNNIVEFKSDLLREKYYKIKHESGLEIYVFPKNMSTSYALLGTRYGSVYNVFKNKNDEEYIHVPNGIAHFLEHKMFSNEDGTSSDQTFAQYGANSNAYTSFDKTVYLFSCTDNFYESLEELVRFVTHPYFTKETVDKEQGIIGQEIKMYEDDPYEANFFSLLDNMYENNPVKVNICGTIQSIAKITPELLYSCHKTFYNPSNMILVACGNIDVDKVFEIVDKGMPKEYIPFETDLYFPKDDRKVVNKYFEKSMQVAKPLFTIGIKDIDISDNARERMKKDIILTILDEMLFSRAGELYNKMFESGLITPSYSYGNSITKFFSFNAISGESNDPKKVLKTVLDYIDEKKKSGLSREDFERNKKVIYAENVKALDSTDSIANSLFSFLVDGIEMFDYLDIVNEVTFEDVENMLKSSFDEECITLSVIKPIK